ncbi:MAG: hypothetical protein ACK5N9_16050 [Pirellula sp.]
MGPSVGSVIGTAYLPVAEVIGKRLCGGDGGTGRFGVRRDKSTTISFCVRYFCAFIVRRKE